MREKTLCAPFLCAVLFRRACVDRANPRDEPRFLSYDLWALYQHLNFFFFFFSLELSTMLKLCRTGVCILIVQREKNNQVREIAQLGCWRQSRTDNASCISANMQIQVPAGWWCRCLCLRFILWFKNIRDSASQMFLENILSSHSRIPLSLFSTAENTQFETCIY